MKKIISAVLVCTLLFSCGKNPDSKFPENATKVSDMNLVKPEPQDKAISNELSTSDSSGNASSTVLQGTVPGQNTDWDKKIIKTADIQMEVKNFSQYNIGVHNAVKQYGGYIANEEQNFSEEKKESVISIKVPVDQFDNLMNQLPSDSNKVIEKKVTTEDVTGEVIDIKSRLEAKEQTRLKYLEFLKQAKNMNDVLKVQTEINSLQEEMEAASGRVNYLSHQSAYSTINLTFYQPLTTYKPVDNNPGFAARIIDAFKAGFSFLSQIFIALIYIWPVYVVIFIAWIFLKKQSLRNVAVKQKQ